MMQMSHCVASRLLALGKDNYRVPCNYLWHQSTSEPNEEGKVQPIGYEWEQATQHHDS